MSCHEARKAIEAEIKHYEYLATLLEKKLKEVSESLMAERDTYKLCLKDQNKKIIEVEHENIELKAINGQLNRILGVYETYLFNAFPAHGAQNHHN